MNTEKIQAVQSNFEKLGIIAMHGGRKGNGFWLYLGTIGCGRALLNNGKVSGNPFFWMMKDAESLVELIA